MQKTKKIPLLIHIALYLSIGEFNCLCKNKKLWHLIVILWQGAYELNLDFSALHKYKQEVKKANFTIGVAGIAGTLYYSVPRGAKVQSNRCPPHELK